MTAGGKADNNKTFGVNVIFFRVGADFGRRPKNLEKGFRCAALFIDKTVDLGRDRVMQNKGVVPAPEKFPCDGFALARAEMMIASTGKNQDSAAFRHRLIERHAAESIKIRALFVL